MWENFLNWGGGSDPNPLLDVYLPSYFWHAKMILRCQNMFYKKGGGDIWSILTLNNVFFLGKMYGYCICFSNNANMILSLTELTKQRLCTLSWDGLRIIHDMMPECVTLRSRRVSSSSDGGCHNAPATCHLTSYQTIQLYLWMCFTALRSWNVRSRYSVAVTVVVTAHLLLLCCRPLCFSAVDLYLSTSLL